jgi:hypothetical protein
MPQGSVPPVATLFQGETIDSAMPLKCALFNFSHHTCAIICRFISEIIFNFIEIQSVKDCLVTWHGVCCFFIP